jgi:hypothetical protein
MKAKAFGIVAVTLVLFAAVNAGQLREILPPDGFLPGWHKGDPVRIFVGQDLFNHIDGGAELYLEFGFERLLVQPYTNGASELGLEVYEMKSPAAALGIYLFQAGRESPWPELKARNSSEEAQIAAFKGRFFVRLNNFDNVPGAKPIMIALANALLSSVPDVPLADPFRVLPEPGRIAGSERLIRGPVGLQPYYTFGEGDILGLDGRIFAVLADYRDADGSTTTRLIVDYGDPAAAASALKNLRANLDPYLKVTEARDAGFSFVDHRSRPGRVDHFDSRLEIVFQR